MRPFSSQSEVLKVIHLANNMEATLQCQIRNRPRVTGAARADIFVYAHLWWTCMAGRKHLPTPPQKRWFSDCVPRCMPSPLGLFLKKCISCTAAYSYLKLEPACVKTRPSTKHFFLCLSATSRDKQNNSNVQNSTRILWRTLSIPPNNHMSPYFATSYFTIQNTFDHFTVSLLVLLYLKPPWDYISPWAMSVRRDSIRNPTRRLRNSSCWGF